MQPTKRNLVRTFFSLLSFALFVLHGLAGTGLAEERRLIPFEPGDSLEQIEEKIRVNGYSFRVNHNWVFDLPAGEKELLRGRRMQTPTAEQKQASSLRPRVRLARRALPAAFDLRNYSGRSYIGPVRDQGPIGSCYSFGAAAAAESTYNMATQRFDGDTADFSESYIAWTLPLVYPYGSHFSGGDGADYEYYELLALTDPGAGTGLEGIISEEDFPYQTAKVTTEMQLNSITKPRITFDSWSRVYPDDYAATTDEIKNAIMTNGAVDAAVMVTSAFEAYASGVYEDTNTAEAATPYYYSATNHAISLVGWDDNPPEGGGGVWILRNSWGSTWGENGYMRIRYFSARVNTAVALLIYHDTMPVAVTGEAGSITENSAVLNGTVNPAGDETTYYFEYGTTAGLGSTTDSVSAGAGTTDAAVTAAISNLEPQLTYYYRLAAQNSAGVRYSAIRTFATGGSSPVPAAVTGAVSGVGVDAAVLSGTVNPRGLAVSYYFEYGTTTGYGAQTTAVDLSAATSLSAVEQPLSGLLPQTMYHYRLVAASSAGTAYGADRIFTTPQVILAEHFETTVPPASWSEAVAYTGGTPAPDWAFYQASMCTADDAVCTPHGGTGMARFNSYATQQENKARLVTPALNLLGKGNVRLSFWMYRNTWFANADYLQVQVSADGTTWLNAGDRCQRYTGDDEWVLCSVSLDYLAGRATGYVGILGVSAYGDNMYIDDLQITAENTYQVTGRVTEDGEGVAGVTVTLAGDEVETATTGTGGAYSFSGVLNGIYSVTPARYGYTFSPESSTETVAGADRQNIDFSTTSTQFIVHGTVQSGGAPLGDAIVTLSPLTLALGVYGETYRTVSLADGSFSLADVANGHYQLRVEINGVVVAEEQVQVDGGDLTLALSTSDQAQTGRVITAFWNGYLEMTNILELTNKSTETLEVAVVLLDSEGESAEGAVERFTVGAFEERDFVLNELGSFSADSYGLLQITLSHNNAEGRVSYYRPAADAGSWDYSYSLPLSEPLYGQTFAISNTYSPESSQPDATVTNWLSLANLSGDPQNFTVNYYDIIGELVQTQTVSVPPMARRDIDGGHEAFGPSTAGLISIQPEAANAPYLAVLSRYGRITIEDADYYDFAFAAPAQAGNGARQILPVNAAANILNYLELANVSSEELGVMLDYFDAAGQNVQSSYIILFPYGQQHIAAPVPVDNPFSGTVQLHPERAGSLVAGSAAYYYSAVGEYLESAEYSTVLAPAVARRVSSYNLYLNMANWLRVFNASSSTFTVNLTLDPGLSSERTFPLTVPARGRLDFGLHEQARFGLTSGTYGMFRLDTPQPQDSLFQLLRVIPTAEAGVDALSTVVVR